MRNAALTTVKFSFPILLYSIIYYLTYHGLAHIIYHAKSLSNTPVRGSLFSPNKENWQEILGGASTSNQSLLIVNVKSPMNASTVFMLEL